MNEREHPLVRVSREVAVNNAVGFDAFAETTKFAWPGENQAPSDVPIDEAISAMRHIADSAPHGTMEKDRARARAIGAEADKWRPKMKGDQKALKRIDVFIRSYL